MVNSRDQKNIEIEKTIHTLTSSVVHFQGNNNCNGIHAICSKVLTSWMMVKVSIYRSLDILSSFS